MPAPTALQRRPEEFAENIAQDISMEASAVPLPEDTSMTDDSGRPKFAPASAVPLAFRREQRKVPIPPHRMTPLKTAWPKMYPPLVEHLKLQVRTNIKAKAVELRTSNATTDTGALQKGEV
jgi:RNA-binding protein PNO1